jgi:uncharacterized protein DUF6328
MPQALRPPLEARNETALQRCDRNLAELLQEVRVAQTGVQVLFAFLLTVPFTVRFERIAAAERSIYFATLLLAGAAAMLLIAPTSHHRVLFACGDKERLVVTANRYAIAGLVAVAAAMVGVVLLVSLLVVGGLGAALTTTAAGAACIWCWCLQPLRRRHALYRASRAPDSWAAVPDGPDALTVEGTARRGSARS